jgi:hypothetical protein
MDELDQLLDIVTTGVADIKRIYADAGRSPPRLEEPYGGPDELEKTLAPATTLVVSAAKQLIATLHNPTLYVADSFQGVSSIRWTGYMHVHNLKK